MRDISFFCWHRVHQVCIIYPSHTSASLRMVMCGHASPIFSAPSPSLFVCPTCAGQHLGCGQTLWLLEQPLGARIICVCFFQINVIHTILWCIFNSCIYSAIMYVYTTLLRKCSWTFCVCVWVCLFTVGVWTVLTIVDPRNPRSSRQPARPCNGSKLWFGWSLVQKSSNRQSQKNATNHCDCMSLQW